MPDSSPPAPGARAALPPVAHVVLAFLATAKLLLHLLTANHYGIFRDEMYGLACAEHLDWGYYSHPPGGIVIAWAARHWFGDSLLGLRFLPALAGAGLVWMTGAVTRELGGRTFAQALAAFAVGVAPVYLIFDHWLMMNAFEPLVWLGALWCVLRAASGGGPGCWILFGGLGGVGLELKYSMAFLLLGVLVGLALTPQRSQLRRGSLWIGLSLAAALALPNFLWQAHAGFPFLQHLQAVRASGRDVVRGPLDFLVDQAVIMQPAFAPVWLAGVAWLFLGPERRRTRGLGWVFVVVLAVVILQHGKNYYSTPVYPIAFAAGAVALERGTLRGRGTAVRWAYVGAAVAFSLALLPLAVPLLPPDQLVRYEAALHLQPPAFEHQNNGPLPQYFADEFGWEAMVSEVARVYHGLTPAEQARTAIFANSWGDAAAIDFFGPRYGLPKSICKVDNYWLWGPRDYAGDIVIVLHSDGSGDRAHFARVEVAGRVQHPYSRRDGWYDIFLCRGLNQDLRTMWPGMMTWD